MHSELCSACIWGSDVASHTLDSVFTRGVTIDRVNISEVVLSDHKSVSFNVSCNSESFSEVCL